ncbi:MAG: chemotaxis protein CheW [Spirochaetales bacterium]|nr:chemotaxis protein CheW [Spirochaetales bacterium]
MAIETIAAVSTYLTFTLGEEQYAVDVSKAREVLELPAVTKVPRTPEFMRGVINLRGNVVPVCDLRLKFGLGPTGRTIDTRVVVMEIEYAGETAVLGALADSVQEVIELEAGQIEPPPKIGMNINTEFIRGMGKRNDRFIIILDIDRVFSPDEMERLAKVKEADESPQTEEKAP